MVTVLDCPVTIAAGQSAPVGTSNIILLGREGDIGSLFG
jgi:hypothetical protein